MSVALWIIDPGRGVSRRAAIRRFGGGTFGIVSMPLESSTKAHCDAMRGAGFRVNLYMSGTGHASADAGAASEAITRLGPVGLVDFDSELPDNELAGYMDSVVDSFRAIRPGFPIRLNIAPNKHSFLPAHRWPADQQLYALMQTYYGNMQGRYSEATALAQLLSVGVPVNRASVAYAAMCDVFDATVNKWHRCLTLPSVFLSHTGTSSADIVGPLSTGPVFSDDLLADSGLLV